MKFTLAFFLAAIVGMVAAVPNAGSPIEERQCNGKPSNFYESMSKNVKSKSEINMENFPYRTW
ncbi:hypothetical protein AJ79_05404 [Helicocarpus griseus UAMH5409]|uniref:Uncharacterized protein n=1 Tax=Helicocarpus griseus UAMH5409 TaxID=1447875 RepID=A0A2B7XPM7_9EURO|nr:hypothetical protein AJ79_05404 [Helicocarpus griseus UAMH5409]